ncbi:DNA phosphorothioation-dependent restriction protein DptH [Tuberibacillus sp. Marseille-P3662]|uniref:DNA phosphorothioation-dependent restriction protein DptH n=1 Tax=Tuberibacillus sp. Marseille-P3662 TaxID=1965358 RepID=UPI000A1CBE1C|nr:DNA phosphorothioation-dependent restriction protein DptH [Tuberibacillus sp. Marseille-P3662]
MSSQFYNYISDLILGFFQEQKINMGDRFYLQLDNKDDVYKLVQALSTRSITKEFIYQHQLGQEYRTFSIEINDVKLVVAHTSDLVKPDFLVTLRNLVGDQEGKWKNTALLSIVSEQLDSIQGGSSDLQKEGMPLHPNYLFNHLKNEIENSTLDRTEQKILLNNLDSLKQDQLYQQITFFELEDLFTILAKGSIEDHDYKNFSLFKDNDLHTYTGHKLKERLALNQELFNYVKKIHDFGLGEDELEKRFSPIGVSKLSEEGWEDLSFSEVHRYHEEHQKLNKKTKIELKDVKVKDRLDYWDKPEKETSTGNRKRHVIIFNPEQNDFVNIQASFLIQGGNIKSLSNKFMTVKSKFKSNLECKVGQKNLNFEIKVEKNKPTFVKANYKHDKKASLGAEFNIVVLPIQPDTLEACKTKYIVSPNQELIEFQYGGEQLVFGSGSSQTTIDVEKDNDTIKIVDDQNVSLNPQPEAFNEEEQLLINMQTSSTTIPLLLKNEIPESTPITGQRIWKLKRESEKDFEWKHNRLVFGNREFYLHPEYRQHFEWELEWLERNIKCARLESDQLMDEPIALSSRLEAAYYKYVSYFKNRNHVQIPSLCYFSKELEARAKDFVKAFIEEIKSFQSGIAAGKKGRDLFKLGTILSNNEVYFTPFHPLIIAFQMKTNEMLSNEEVDNSLLSRLQPNALVPYIYNDYDQLYKADSESAAPEWLKFKPVKQISVTDANQYLANIVEDKMTQFKDHFDYLFIKGATAPLMINVINIVNDQEVLKGIIRWMLTQINKNGPENLVPIEIALYNDDITDSSFDLFSRTDSPTLIEEYFSIRLKTKDKDYDAQDLLRYIRENLFFYKQNAENGYKYAHISFYKMHARENYAVQPMTDMFTGMSIEGLYSSVPAVKGQENYRSGFGVKAFAVEENNLLTQTAYFTNELVANLRNGGNDSYRKDEAIFARTTTADEDTLNRIFASSYWVTFVDPNIDLEFFNKYRKNLVIIHYSDQYSSSSRFDAITVTDKSQQYYSVIKDFLKRKDVDPSDEHVKNTVKAFNTFNGEWLLRIIGSKGHYSREKLSIISAIKFSLAYFDHPNIRWVPISLEEILRVAGAVSLNKSDGIFTAKNLGVRGSHSDDLLLIGLELINDQIKVHFYPIEVKVGNNYSDVLNKAKDQVSKTQQLLKNALLKNSDTPFASHFYRNFFVQLLISHAQKLEQNDIWKNKDYQLSETITERLLKDQYNVSFDLEPIIGKGAILSFRKDAIYRSVTIDEDITVMDLSEQDGYNGLIKPVDELKQWIHVRDSDFVKEVLLANQYNSEIVPTGDSESYKTRLNSDEDKILKNDTISNEEDAKHETEKEVAGKENLENQRVLIGKAANSNRNIYWEYGNKGLANRHLLISGKSGQGKTYFMQCLLLELSKRQLPSIVIDYTEGFLPNQLEQEFTDYLDHQLKQTVVFNEQFPINPFKKNHRDIGGITLPESNTDVAERIKSVFAAVYKSLGIQQLNAIYETTLSGLEKYGDSMSLTKLRDELEANNSSYAKTTLSQIRPLIDRNPFNHENTINWDEIIKSVGDVYIIQLTGYPRDVQLMITEFILWDLWNYSVRFGDKNNPINVVMDEAQNLDHTENSPSAKILTEGRKFGWSGWYATQFLKSQLELDELARLQNSSQKVYFAPPEQEVSSIASSISNDKNEKKKWEAELSGLKKGQCIVNGPVKKENGELSHSTPIIVNIASLSERLTAPSLLNN